MIAIETTFREIGTSDNCLRLAAGQKQIELGMEDAVVRFGDEGILCADQSLDQIG